jgi:HK97 family phage prohead protease
MSRFIDELRSHIGPVSNLRAALGEVEVRAAGGDGADSSDFIFTGHAAVFDVPSEQLGGKYYSFTEQIARGAFRKALAEDQDVVYVYDHGGLVLARTSAKTLELREDPRGLYVYARAAPTTVASDLAIAMRAGNVKHMSFAFTTAEDHWEETTHEDGTVEAVRTVLKVERLYDTSPVGQPAYVQTDAQVRSRELGRIAERYGLPNPPELPDNLDELAQRVASTESTDTEASKAGAPEQRDGAKRGLHTAHLYEAQAHARTHGIL